PNDGKGVRSFNLYWGSSPTTRIGSMIARVTATGADVSYALPSTAVPPGTTHLLAFSANSAGEAQTAAVVVSPDNYPVYTDITSGVAGVQGPTAVIDPLNGKLLVTANVLIPSAQGYKGGLLRCNLDGTACRYVDISAGKGISSGYSP